METTRGAMKLSFTIEDQNGNNVTCSSERSPDSGRSSSSWSCGTSDSPADVDMEDFICDPTSKGESSSTKVVVKSSGTIVVDLGSSKTGNGNESMTFLIEDSRNSATECDERGKAEICDRSSEASDGEEQELSEVDSCRPSRCGSSENCCSVSSGEMMMMRSNVFISHETEQPLSISLPDESRTSLDISSNPGVVSSMLPDVCEALQEEHSEKVFHREPRNQGLESTHIQPSNQTFLIARDLIQMSSDSQRETNEKSLPCNTSGSSHSTMLLTASKDLDISGNAQTSTPVQSVDNNTFRLPPLSESLLQKDEGESASPMAQVTSGQKGDSSQKPKSLMAAGKSNKVEMTTKPNFSNIKSKMMSGTTKPFKTSSAQVPKTFSSSVPQSNEDRSMNRSAQSKTSTKSTPIYTCSTPANVRSSTAAKRTRSSTYQESGPASKSQPRRWSESATFSKNGKDGSQEKKAQVNGALATLTTPQTGSKGGSLNQVGKTKPSEGYVSFKVDTQASESLKACGKNLKISLLATSARPLTGAAAREWSRGRPDSQPSMARTGGRAPDAKLQPPLSAASKLKLGTTGRVAQFTGSPTAPASKLLVKPKTQPKGSSTPQTNGHPKQDHSEISVEASGKPPSHRSTLLRNTSQHPPARDVSSGCKNASSSSQSSSSCRLLKTSTSARHVRPAATATVDKNKSRTASRNLQPPNNGHPDLVPPESKSRSVEFYKALCEKKNQAVQQLENSVRSNSRRFEAVTVVIKHLCAEQEEGMKQRRERSQELITLREELVSSALSCERLEQEKEELRAAFDGVLQKVQEQHRLDLSDLEERLKTFYSTEWEKVHQTYQEEADKCKALVEQQLEELRSRHKALKKDLEDRHVEEVNALKHHFEESFKELKQSHEKEMENLTTTLKNSEETLSIQIQELITENNDLKEKLKAEEKRRRDLAERTQDSHTLYLEQELESLKVVLDIKHKQIHDQDKKLMQINKLMEGNMKLDDCLQKLQQENEDLKARMDKHAALSRQLSTEQAFLQESLQKESKVNKRLSMENEELLWKLHNGDLSSPRKVSPSPSLTLQSPRNSGMFSSPPISPR